MKIIHFISPFISMKRIFKHILYRLIYFYTPKIYVYNLNNYGFSLLVLLLLYYIHGNIMISLKTMKIDR